MSLITLEGKRGLVVGIANDSSIAYGCAKAFRALGAELAVTYLNAKAERHVKPLADELEASLFLPLDVRNEGELEAERLVGVPPPAHEPTVVRHRFLRTSTGLGDPCCRRECDIRASGRLPADRAAAPLQRHALTRGVRPGNF